MTWEEAQRKIEENMVKGTDINTANSHDRKIVSVDVPLHSYDYHGECGFQVKIGNNTNIGIPWSMLKRCFHQLHTEDGYNGQFFKTAYPKQRNTHACHVHVIGQIFVKSGIAIEKGNRSYFLIEGTV